MDEANEELEGFIHSKRRELERRLGEASLIVFLMGAAGKGLEERRMVREMLKEKGITAIVSEDDLPRDVAPSLVEEYILRSEEVDLAFINVESWGSTAEFVQYHGDPGIAPKLRVLVRSSYHPLYGGGSSYLTDIYLTHLAVYGHVYAYESETGLGLTFPTPGSIVMKLAERYRQWKALR
ncbi:MAG: hypothetical protein QXE79_07180 [Candidatus Bathyarchaeia archaeon]